MQLPGQRGEGGLQGSSQWSMGGEKPQRIQFTSFSSLHLQQDTLGKKWQRSKHTRVVCPFVTNPTPSPIENGVLNHHIAGTEKRWRVRLEKAVSGSG